MRPYQAVMLFVLACSAVCLAAVHRSTAAQCALVDSAVDQAPAAANAVTVEAMPVEQSDD